MRARWYNCLLIVLGAVSLAACSSEQDLPPLAASRPPAAPAPDKAIAGAHAAAAAEKLIDPIEVSDVRKGKSLGPGEYMLCIRGSRSPADPRRTYAVFFHNDDYKDSRPSVILDECETQTYTPLPAATGPIPAAAPNPTPEPPTHRRHHKTQQ